MKTISTLAIAGGLWLSLAVAAATPVRYDGHTIVRTHLSTAEQVETMRHISPDVWSESVGLGVVDFRIPPAAWDTLVLSGIPFEILIDDIQPRIDAEQTRLAAGGAAGGAADGGDWYADFKDRDAIITRFATIAATYPELVEITTLGESIEGRPILGYRISAAPAGSPGVLFNSCQHAREWVSPMVTTFIAEELTSGYGDDPAITTLMDTVEFYIIPIVNPDGYEFSWTDDRLWRKNRRPNGDGTVGVDTNRNWDFGWGGGGSSGDTSDPTYRGTAPFSEPETRAMRDFYQSHPDIVASIDFHSYSQLVLFPWAFQEGGPGDDGQHDAIGGSMSSDIAAVHGMSYVAGPVFETLYQASGGSIDWTWGDQGVISYTIELRDTGAFGFLLPPEQIRPTAEENFPAILTLAGAVAQGAVFSFPAGLPTLVEAGVASSVSVDVQAITSGPLDPASARMFVSVDGDAFIETEMVRAGGSSFTGTLPALDCGQRVEFYFQIDSLKGVTYANPTDAPTTVYAADAVEFTLVYDDDFELDLGWAVENVDLSDGAWEIGVPAGDGDRGDPVADFDGSGACALTGNQAGNSDVDGGPTRLVSAAIDVSGLPDPQLGYARWFTNDDQDEDRLTVELSDDDGASWTEVESVGGGTGWTQVTFAVADFVTPTSTVRVRFSATDNPNNSVTEAAIDAVRFFAAECDEVPGDVDGDGDADFSDLLILISSWGKCPPDVACPADLNGDGTVDFIDLLEVLSSWTG
ncbi:MAG: hypothetical protein HKO59_14725 [Phycisphaerales bacterium]|nr:hypothetical protein [Phycisphaerales bacterium]NNM27213.1 hypothetical protein [Phycisphaerales bacterium]